MSPATLFGGRSGLSAYPFPIATCLENKKRLSEIIRRRKVGLDLDTVGTTISPSSCIVLDPICPSSPSRPRLDRRHLPRRSYLELILSE